MSNVIAQALREYGGAIGGDWSELDGRSVRGQLDTLADALDSGEHRDIEYWRSQFGICQLGGAHWDHYCDGFDNCE